MTDPLLFLAGCLTLLIAPGPTNALLFAAGAARGWRAATNLSLVGVGAYALSVVMARLALEPVLTAMPELAKLVRTAVGLYVLWLAVRLWTSTLRPADAQAITARDLFLTTLLNPKGFIIAFVLLPPGGAEIWPYAGMALTCILAASQVWIGAGAALGQLGGKAAHLAPRASSLALGAFGSLAIGSVFG